MCRIDAAAPSCTFQWLRAKEIGAKNLVRFALGVWLIGGAALVAAANARFPANAMPDGVFPIGVWLQQPEHARRYQALGINVYVGLWQGPTAAQLATLKRAGMPVIATQNEVGLTDPHRDIIVGWLQHDEPDNAQPLVGGVGLARAGWGSPLSPAEMLERYRAIRKLDPLRPIFMNFGKGVAWDAWKGRGNRTGHPEDYLEYVKAADIVSFDIYPAAETDPALAGRLELVAQGVKRLVAWAGPERKVWSVIGASRVNNPDARVDPAQIRAQVWMSIIGGARGILYFVHQFKPRFVEASWFEDPALSAAMGRINAEVQGLARIINLPAAQDVADVSLMGEDGRGNRAEKLSFTARRDGCATYVMVASLVNTPTKLAIRLNFKDNISRIAVENESKILPTVNGRFVDDLPPYGARIYKAVLSPACA